MLQDPTECAGYLYDRYAYARWWERPLIRWCLWWHGEGAAHQPDYYVCHGCGKLVSHNGIRKGGCPCKQGLGQQKLSPARMSVWQKWQIVVCPWTVVH